MPTHGGPKARTQRDIDAHSRKSFADWLDKPIVAITRHACADRFAALSQRGPTTANQAFRYLRSVLNYASNRNWVDDEPLLRHNPVDALKYSWHPTKARSESPFDRVGAVWRMLSAQARQGSLARGERTAAAFVQFLILTGARSGEARELTWDRVQLEAPHAAELDPDWALLECDFQTGPIVASWSAATRQAQEVQPFDLARTMFGADLAA